LLSNIAQSKIQALLNFKAEFAGIARKSATDSGIQGRNPALRMDQISFFDFSASVYPSLCLRLYPRSLKICFGQTGGRAKTVHVGSWFAMKPRPSAFGSNREPVLGAQSDQV